MRKFRVLLVEDDFVSNMECCEVLRESGFAVTETYCSAAALEVIDRPGRLSGLVTDIELGVGPDGFEVARRARVAHPDIRVVYVSGSAQARHAVEGVDGSTFISKPLHPRQVVEALGCANHLEAA